MARNVGIQVENNFIRGLITEATALNFPENAVTETDNCKFDRTGFVTRRLGIDTETPFANTNSPGTSGVVREFLWQGVGQEGDRNFLAVQFGEVVSFFEADSSGNYSGNSKAFSVALVNYLTPESNRSELSDRPCSFASGNGVLFIAHAAMDPVYVDYDEDTDTITTTAITIQIRDILGIDEPGVAINKRLDTITEDHKYNLLNQGFAHTDEDHFEEEGFVYDLWAKEPGYPPYPSNADIPWFWRNEKDQWDGRQVDRGQLGNSPAPKGFYILDAFDLNRSDAVEPDFTVDVDTITSQGRRPSVVAFFAGRVWYMGVDADGFRQDVYYSKIIETEGDYGKCYQINDPTSVELSDLLDSDGGRFKILDMGQAHHAQAIGNRLYIFSTQGVWYIGGSGEGTSFVATDFAINKLSDVPAHTGLSFVSVDGTPMWWNTDGIYTFQPDAAGLNFSVVSATRETIDDFFLDDIPAQSRLYSKGAYDRVSKTVQWVFRSTVASTVANRYEYDRILVLDVVSGAFYPWTVDTTISTICGIFSSADTVVGTTSEDVVDSTDTTVTDSTPEDVTVLRDTTTVVDTKHKYITCTPNVTFDYGETTRSNFVTGTSYIFPSVAITYSQANDWFNRRYFVWSDISDPLNPVLRSFDTEKLPNVSDEIFEITEPDRTLTTPTFSGLYGGFAAFMQYCPYTGYLAMDGVWSGGDGINLYHYDTATYPNSSATPALNSSSIPNQRSYLWYFFSNSNDQLYLCDRQFPSNAWYVQRWTGTSWTARLNWGDSGISAYLVGDRGVLWSMSGTTLRKWSFEDDTVTNTDYSSVYPTSNYQLLAYLHELDYVIAFDSATSKIQANKASDLSLVWEVTDGTMMSTPQTPIHNHSMSHARTRFAIFSDLTGVLAIYDGRNGSKLCQESGFTLVTQANAFHNWDDIGDSLWNQTNTSSYIRWKGCIPAEGTTPLVTAVGEGIIFAEERRTDYVDWYDVNDNLNNTESGINFSSTFTTGEKIAGNFITNQQANYVTVFTKTETDTSCYMNGRFDFSNSGDSGEWSTPQEVYSTKRSNRYVQRKRLKVRGSGPALRLHFKSTDGKPFTILGWAGFVSSNATP